MSPLEIKKWLYDIAYDSKLSIGTPRVAIILAHYCNKDTSQCFPSVNTIINKSRTSKPTVLKALSELEDNRYITAKKKVAKRMKSISIRW